MKKILVSLLALLLLSSNLLWPSCSADTGPQVPKVLEDKQWAQSLNQWLSLSYVEEQDRAAFTGIPVEIMSTHLYTTHYVINMLQSQKIPVHNPDRIADWLISLKTEQGSYLDSSLGFVSPAQQTNRAITILLGLGVAPPDVDRTITFLLSLQSDDGTFFMGPEKDATNLRENSRSKRIMQGTYQVIDTLVKLNRRDKIPQATKAAILEEMRDTFDSEGASPNLSQGRGTDLVYYISMLAMIDPGSVPDEARYFIVQALQQVPNMPAHVVVGPSMIGNLLDAAELLGLPEAKQKTVLDGLREYLQDKIFPLQNLSGGFGPEETTEPLTTAAILAVADRLSVTYPNLPRLLKELEKHRTSDGWMKFLVPSIGNLSYEWTYYAVEIAKMSKYSDYSTPKVERYLSSCFMSKTATLRDVYFAVVGLKSLKNELNTDQKQLATEAALRLAGSGDGIELAYFALITRELGMSVPEEIQKKSADAAIELTADLDGENVSFSANKLSLLWEMLPSAGSEDIKANITATLDAQYSESGGWTTLFFPATPNAGELQPQPVRGPDLYQTYEAMQLLGKMGRSLPDGDKTRNLVLSSKHQYGFDRAPAEFRAGRSLPDLKYTFAALEILKYISN